MKDVYVLLGEAAAVVVIAPLAGVALAGRELRELRLSAIVLALLGGVSMAAAVLIARVPWQAAMAAHLTLAAAAVGLAIRFP